MSRTAEKPPVLRLRKVLLDALGKEGTISLWSRGEPTWRGTHPIALHPLDLSLGRTSHSESLNGNLFLQAVLLRRLSRAELLYNKSQVADWPVKAALACQEGR